MSTREQILHILDSQPTQSNGRINGRLIRSSKYQYFRELVYNETNCLNESTQCKMGELYDKTIRREQIIRSLGYIVITIWESEFK